MSEKVKKEEMELFKKIFQGRLIPRRKNERKRKKVGKGI
jgi:hypothetical protein